MSYTLAPGPVLYTTKVTIWGLGLRVKALTSHAQGPEFKSQQLEGKGGRKKEGLFHHPQGQCVCWTDPLLCVTVLSPIFAVLALRQALVCFPALSPGAKGNLILLNGLCCPCRQRSGCGFHKPVGYRDEAPVVHCSGVCLRVITCLKE